MLYCTILYYTILYYTKMMQELFKVHIAAAGGRGSADQRDEGTSLHTAELSRPFLLPSYGPTYNAQPVVE